MHAVLPTNTTPPARRRSPEAVGVASDDVVLMNYLVAVGRVAEPETYAWRAELLELVAQAHRKLARSEGTFVMGDAHVRLFRVTRDDVAAAVGSGSRHRTGSFEPDDPPTVPFAPIPLTVLPRPEFTPRSSIPRGRMPTPADLEPLPSETAAGAPRRPKVRSAPTPAARVLLGAASLLLAAAVGTVLIAAWTPESEPTAQNVAQTHTQEPALAIPSTTPTADAQDVALARRPAERYVAPAPKPTTRAGGTSSDTARRQVSKPTRKQQQRNQRRTIPNPIPGLPPIVLP